jgi:hypothetical protein
MINLYIWVFNILIAIAASTFDVSLKKKKYKHSWADSHFELRAKINFFFLRWTKQTHFLFYFFENIHKVLYQKKFRILGLRRSASTNTPLHLTQRVQIPLAFQI